MYNFQPTVHFVALIIASAVAAAAQDLLVVTQLYGVIGAMHALCVVVAVRGATPVRALLFVGCTTLCSVFVSWLGIWLIPVLDVPLVWAFFYGIPSLVGASLYAFLISGFWFPHLRRRLIAHASLFCFLATAAASPLFGETLTALNLIWWWVFSVVLVMAANNAFQPTVSNSPDKVDVSS